VPQPAVSRQVGGSRRPNPAGAGGWITAYFGSAGFFGTSHFLKAGFCKTPFSSMES